MKAIILGLIGVGLCINASANTGDDNSIFTMDGVAYKDITSLRVEPDGLVIEYYPPSSGIGMAKIKFSRLTPELQKRFGYDPAKARDFEDKVAKANEDARQDSIRWEQTARTAREARQVREAEMEKVMNDRLIALAQLRQAQGQSQASVDDPSGGGFGYGYGGWFPWGRYRYPVSVRLKTGVRNHVTGNVVRPPWHPIFPGIDAVHR